MWVSGEAAAVVEQLPDEEILLGAGQLLRSIKQDCIKFLFPYIMGGNIIFPIILRLLGRISSGERRRGPIFWGRILSYREL